MVDGVQVERVGGLAFSRASHLHRAVSYLSLYPAMLRRAWRLPPHDIIVTLTDPPLQLLLGPILKWARKAKLIHWAQDIYPELAEELGVLRKDGLFAKLLRFLSTWALRKSDSVVAVGHCMKRRLTERGLDAAAIEVIPNWGHSTKTGDALRNAEREAGCSERSEEGAGIRFRREQNLDDNFVVMYSGNLGLAHPFEAILDAAERLQIALPRVVFVFVGSGPRLPWVKKQVEWRHLLNVRFLPFQPKERLLESLAAADVHLASMRQELCGLVVPSKVYGVLAACRPCVFLGPEESETAQVILRQGCGSVLSKATGARLAACLSQWANHPELLREATRRAEDLAPRIDLQTAVGLFENVFAGVPGADSSATEEPRLAA